MFADQDAHIVAMQLQHNTTVFLVDKFFHDDIDLHGLENLGQEFFGFVYDCVVHYKFFGIFIGRAFVFAFCQRILDSSRYGGSRFYFLIYRVLYFIPAFLDGINGVIPFFFYPVVKGFLPFIQFVCFFPYFA